MKGLVEQPGFTCMEAFFCALQQQSYRLARATAHEGLHCLQLLRWRQITVVCRYTESPCLKPPEFQPNGGLNTLWSEVGSSVRLNCTALLLWDPDEEQCDTTLQWSKDGQPLSNLTLSMQNDSSWWLHAFKAVDFHYYAHALMQVLGSEGETELSVLLATVGPLLSASWWWTVCWWLRSGRRRILGCTAAHWGMFHLISAYRFQVRKYGVQTCVVLSCTI